VPPSHLQQCLWMAAHTMASQLRAYEGLGGYASTVNCLSALANDKNVSARIQAEKRANVAGRKREISAEMS
jgi:hypothetical protein